MPSYGPTIWNESNGINTVHTFFQPSAAVVAASRSASGISPFPLARWTSSRSAWSSARVPVDPKKGVIRLSTDLNVKFPSVSTICAQYSTVWRLDRHDGQYLISTGGVEGNPDRKTLSNSFKIKKQDDDYKLFYCPTTVCNEYNRCKRTVNAKAKAICKDVGIYIDGYGTRHLALSDKPFRVMFKKAAA